MDNKIEDMQLNKENFRSLVKAAVSKLGGRATKEEKIEQAKIMIKVGELGLSPKEAMNMSDEEYSSMYSFGYSLFNSGKTAEACELFKLLYMLDPFKAEMALALGVCHHRLNHYELAASAYMASTYVDRSNPLPLFYAYDCFMKLNNKAAAGMMLYGVIAKSGDDPKYEKLKQKAEVMLTALEEEMNAEKAAGQKK